MSNRPSPHRLLNPRIKRCPCGKCFEVGLHYKYCSYECEQKAFKEKQSKKNNNKNEFLKEHPEICRRCGCNNSKSKFRNCLQCRIKLRLYQNARYKKK